MMKCLQYFVLLFVLVMRSAAMIMKNTPSDNTTRKPWRQTLANHGDLQYYGRITVGNQKLNGVFDTGSIELVVLSDECNYWCGESANLYHSKESQLHKKGGLSISMSYGSGDLRGREAYDTIGIGPFHVTDAPFWEVSDATMPVLLDSDFQAIIGLGPIASNLEVMVPGEPKTNVSYALVLEKLNLFKYSVCLMKDSGMPGYITWDDDIHYKHPKIFNELSISHGSYWTVKMENVRLGSGSVMCKSGCGAIIDSGTSLLAMPEHAYSSMNRLIRELGAHCNNLAALPNLHFTLNGIEYALPPDSYLGQVHGKPPFELAGHFEKMSTSCQPSLMKVHMESTFGETWILGVPFFRSYLTVFDQSKGKQPKIFTTPASDDCSPPGLGLGLNSQVMRVARTIDAAKLHLPDWARGKLHARKGQIRQIFSGKSHVRPLQHKRKEKHST